MEAAYNQIKVDVERIRSGWKWPDMHGEQFHKYHLNPVLSEIEITRFEEIYNTTLPQDYRSFLLNVGNGGAGPHYGVFKLGEIDGGKQNVPWSASDIGNLGQPWPRSVKWNHTAPDPEDKEATREFLKRYHSDRPFMADFDAVYSDSCQINGAIPICHEGCNYYTWLVLTGPEAGNLWGDGRSEICGLRPLQQDDRPRVTFFQWYRRWLDLAMAKLISP